MKHEAPSKKKGRAQRKLDPLEVFPDKRICLYSSMCEYIYIHIYMNIFMN